MILGARTTSRPTAASRARLRSHPLNPDERLSAFPLLRKTSPCPDGAVLWLVLGIGAAAMLTLIG